MIKKIGSKINLDSIGFSASFICAIHCALIPIILTSLSASNFSFFANPVVEIFMISVSVLVGLISLLPSYKVHKNLIAIVTMFIGFILIFAGHFIVRDIFESILTPLGAFIVAISHLINLKQMKNCHICIKEHIE